MATREQKVYMAGLAQETDRYNDLVQIMKEVVAFKEGLNRDEANLFSVGYKRKISSCREAWRIISVFEPKEEDASGQFTEIIAMYRKRIEDEMEAICNEVIQLINDLLPTCDGIESKAFFLKMKADYYRYLSEFVREENFDMVVQEARAAYEEASKVAEQGLQEAHPVRLGIALNFSVFYYEALADPEKACELARAALATPDTVVEAQEEEQAQDSKNMLQLLRDNLNLWTDQVEGEEGGNDADDQDND